MTDYTTLIDAETWVFIRETDAWYPPDAVGLTVEEQRAVYNRMCRAFHRGYPDGVTATDLTIDSGGHALPLRRYTRAGGSAAAAVLYFHGGGFVVGGLESHDDVCAEICGATGFDVISVDYRLAPEHRHPAAFDDAAAAFDWLSRDTQLPLVLAGDSAGGNLAAAVAHAARGRDRAAVGQVLIYPGLGGPMDRGSWITHAEAPMLSVRDILFYRDIRAGAKPTDGDPTAAPLQDTDFSGLPPTAIFTAECDPLSSDGELYRDRIVAAGGRARWTEERGLVHGYLRARRTVSRARDSFARIVEAIGEMGRADR